MKKIQDGTYRAVRCDASGYVYGEYLDKQGRDKHAPPGNFIDADPNDNWVTPIKMETLVYRVNGKWVKV
jgi:hypothetical protein